MINWRIYYADGSTYSDADGEWMKAPERGVICVVVRDPTGAWGRWVNSGFAPRRPRCEHCGRATYNEYYVNLPDGDEPRATHELTAFRAQAQRAGVNDVEACIKYGEQAPQEVWNAIMQRAVEDPDFPKGTPRRRYSDFKE